MAKQIPNLKNPPSSARALCQAMKLRLSSNYREGKPPPPAFFEVENHDDMAIDLAHFDDFRP